MNRVNILGKIEEYANTEPKRIAMYSGNEYISYGQLEEESDYLAAYIEERSVDKSPVAIYGHKTSMMLVAMLACVKSGRAYCPIDISVPSTRVQMILEQMDSNIVLAVEEMECRNKEIISLQQMKKVIADKKEKIAQDCRVTGEDVFYIIFTSGSTGQPKGVQITTNCLNHYLDWSVNLGTSEAEKKGKVFLNQAPFSFDLSVMDLYTSLACGGTLWTLDKNTQGDYRALMESLKDSMSSVWVSTPSFAEICLSEKQFNKNLMPMMDVFLFCGETLTNATAEKLQNRFPNAKIVNTYGPTESTVAVTDVLVTSEIAKTNVPLPVGEAKPGTYIEIWSKAGKPVVDGKKGEIIILGDTVSSGYYKKPEITKKAFFTCIRKDRIVRGYHTGDEGYLADGQLYYCGRIDLQVKLHGYRIEIEDIENNLLKIDAIRQVVVLPNMKENKVRSLSAYMVYNKPVEDKMKTTLWIKQQLKEFLPDYMIPKKFIFLDKIPMTNNGKADRRSLGGI